MKILFALISLAASAKTEVVYFGGYRASPAQIRCWEKGARADTAKNRGFGYRGIAWPDGAPSAPQSAVIRAGRAQIGKLVREIDANPNVRYVIAGHSSGAALSNQVAREVKNPQQLVLIDLDGFRADDALQRRVKTQCWSAERREAGGRVVDRSRNAGSMGLCRDHRTFVNGTCRPGASMCLHFSLVNTRVPPDLGGDFATRGYESCATNLDWVPAE